MKMMGYIEWRKMVLPSAVDCDECNGTGYVECDECDGTGQYECEECYGMDDDCKECEGDGNIDCYGCNGTGNETCKKCHSEGKVGISYIDYQKQLEKDKELLDSWLDK